MLNHKKDLTYLYQLRSEAMPDAFATPEKLDPLMAILPRCSYSIINRIGSIMADRWPRGKENIKAKGSDLDLSVTVSLSTPELWAEAQSFVASGELEVWGDQENALVASNNILFVLHPRYSKMDREARQAEVCRLIQSKIKNPSDSQLHTISTGETILYVAPGIADVSQPKKEYLGPYGEIYPVIIEESKTEEQAYIDLGYLPDQGRTIIAPNGNMYNLTVCFRNHQDFQPDLEAYAARSPNHAIMFLRRLTKSTIATLRHATSHELQVKRLNEFHRYYQEVWDNYVAPFDLDDAAQSSVKSLNKKIETLTKLENKFIKLSSKYFLSQPQNPQSQ